MSKLWPTRRHDIKIARLFIKKHSPVSLEDIDPNTLSPEEKLDALYPWVAPMIRRFRQDHPNRDWVVNMLRAIDAVIKPHFKSQQQAAAISQGVVACIRMHIQQNNLDDTFDRPENEVAMDDASLNTEAEPA